jgi:hypothetical protein
MTVNAVSGPVMSEESLPAGTAAGFLIVAKTEEAGPVFLAAGSCGSMSMFVFQ